VQPFGAEVPYTSPRASDLTIPGSEKLAGEWLQRRSPLITGDAVEVASQICAMVDLRQETSDLGGFQDVSCLLVPAS
jgi:hypothetical protein